MGLIDYFKPIPELNCPNCQAVLSEWQGKPYGCAMFVWHQGIAYPLRQEVDEECAISEEDKKKLRLPDEFDFYTDCENCPDYWIVADGKTENGIWTKVENLRLEKKNKLPRKWFDQEIKRGKGDG